MSRSTNTNFTITQPLGHLASRFGLLRGHSRNSIKDIVVLPRGKSCAAWVAVHAIDFYQDVSTIWAVIADDPQLDTTFRPGEGFPTGVRYHWEHSCVSAPVYIEKVLQWIGNQIDDETNFPNDDNIDEYEVLRRLQTPVFASLCAQIFRRLFRVYGIIYTSFFGMLEALQMAPHLDVCFKHFMFFSFEFGLIPEREMEPLAVFVKPKLHQFRLAGGTGEREDRNTRREIIEEFEYDGQERVPWGVINVKFYACVHTVGIDAFFSHRSLRKVVLNEGLVWISGMYKL